MTGNNFLFYSFRIFFNIVRDILYFPVWWYSRGLFRFASSLFDFLINKEKSLALFVWIKNIFRPMYNQYDWQGMLISFFVRIVQIIFRSLLMFFWFMICLAIFLSWLFLPVLTVYEIIFQIFH